MSDSSLPIWRCPGYRLIGHPTEVAHLWLHKAEYCIKHRCECAVGPGAFGSTLVLVNGRPFALSVLCDRDSGDHGSVHLRGNRDPDCQAQTNLTIGAALGYYRDSVGA